MRALNVSLAMMLVSVSVPAVAVAAVAIRVDLSSQTMQVSSNSGEQYLWPVSTARKGFSTPRGTYGVLRLDAMHYSRKYQNAPMPHSIFFHGGYAIHGSYETASLGRAASHGCIRLSPANAAVLYHMVAAEGARITITGSALGRIAGETRRHRLGPRLFQSPDDFVEPAGSDGWSSDSGEGFLQFE